jgi:hypothetical protein
MQGTREKLTLQTTESASVISPSGRSTSPDLVDVAVFIIPCTQFIQVKLLGVLSGSDILLLITALFLVARGKVKIETTVGKWAMILCSLWLASQCATDVVRHSPFIDYARGWSNIGMTIVNFSVLWTLLYGRPHRIAIYGWGLVVGSLLTYFIIPDDFMVDYPWKFGMSYPVTLGVFLLVSRVKWRNRGPIFAILMIGVINIYLGSRNRGGSCLAGALFLWLNLYLNRGNVARVKLRASTVAAIALVILCGAVFVFESYQYVASKGMLGTKAEVEFENQSSGEYGLLVGGRTEMLGSIPAIYDSPILGHGSWAKDPSYLIAERQALALMGYTDAANFSAEELDEGLIPSHSYLFGAWVNAGFLGAVFWGWVFFLTAKALMRVYPRSVTLLPVMSFVAFSMLWDVLFSPYGATGRIIFPYYFVMLATCMSMAPITKAADLS